MSRKINRGSQTKIQEIPSDVTAETLKDILNATSRSQGGGWRLTGVSSESRDKMKLRFTKPREIEV